jgi:hypothetical protein
VQPINTSRTPILLAALSVTMTSRLLRCSAPITSPGRIPLACNPLASALAASELAETERAAFVGDGRGIAVTGGPARVDHAPAVQYASRRQPIAGRANTLVDVIRTRYRLR